MIAASEQNTALSEIAVHEPKRRCSGCGWMKPKVDFPRHSKSNQCLECRRQYNRVYKQLSRKGFCQQICRNVGIETWEQVDSVIRAMAESQYGIQKEYAALEKKITILKNDTEKVVEFDLCHQINYHSILMVFLKKVCQPGRATRRKFNFGSLRFCRGKLRVDLKVDYAGQRIGKP